MEVVSLNSIELLRYFIKLPLNTCLVIKSDFCYDVNEIIHVYTCRFINLKKKKNRRKQQMHRIVLFFFKSIFNV